MPSADFLTLVCRVFPCRVPEDVDPAAYVTSVFWYVWPFMLVSAIYHFVLRLRSEFLRVRHRLGAPLGY